MEYSAVQPNKTFSGNLWQIGATVLALGFLYFSVLSKLGRDWWFEENYSHGLLIPFIIGYIVWLEFDTLRENIRKPVFLLGGCVIVFALMTLLGGTLGAELYAQRMSLFLMLAGIVLYFWGARVLQLLATPFLLLFLAIPVPTLIFNQIAMPLQTIASKLAIWGIKILEIPSVREGNVIEILPRGAMSTVKLEVVEACSGIRSLMTLVTIAVILGYFTRRNKKAGDLLSYVTDFDFWRILVLMISAIPIAIVTNAARVTATGWMTYSFGRQSAEGFSHNFAGWLVYLAALLLLLGLNWLLNRGFKLWTRGRHA
jgi:exosortase